MATGFADVDSWMRSARIDHLRRFRAAFVEDRARVTQRLRELNEKIADLDAELDTLYGPPLDDKDCP